MFGISEILGLSALQKAKKTCMTSRDIEYSIPLHGQDAEFDAMVDIARVHLNGSKERLRQIAEQWYDRYSQPCKAWRVEED